MHCLGTPIVFRLLVLLACFACTACGTSEWYRGYGIYTAEELQNPSSLPLIVKALHDEDEDVRVLAAEALAKHGHSAQEALPELLILQNDDNPRVRVAAIEALTAAGTSKEDISPALISVILSDNPNARRLGVLLHQRIGYVNEETLDALQAVASGDPHPRLRPLAASVIREVSIQKVLKKKEAVQAETAAAMGRETLTPEMLGMIPSVSCQARPDDLAVVIGIEKYQRLGQQSEYSARDAHLIKEVLKALCFEERNIDFLTNEHATLSAIRKSFEAWLPNNVRKNSKVFVYYSGHGAPDTKGGGYLVPYDGDPNYLEITAYPLERLYSMLGSIDAEEKIVVMDSCFSGAGGRSVLPRGARPIFLEVKNPVFLAGKTMVLVSSKMSQISTSFPEKEQGLFTYYFVEALKNNKFAIEDIYSHIRPAVENEAKRMNIEQSPQLFSSGPGEGKVFSLY